MTSMSAIERENSCGFVDVAALEDGGVPSSPTIALRAIKLLHTKSIGSHDGASIDCGGMGFERLIRRQ